MLFPELFDFELELELELPESFELEENEPLLNPPVLPLLDLSELFVESFFDVVLDFPPEEKEPDLNPSEVLSEVAELFLLLLVLDFPPEENEPLLNPLDFELDDLELEDLPLLAKSTLLLVKSLVSPVK